MARPQRQQGDRRTVGFRGRCHPRADRAGRLTGRCKRQSTQRSRVHAMERTFVHRSLRWTGDGAAVPAIAQRRRDALPRPTCRMVVDAARHRAHRPPGVGDHQWVRGSRRPRQRGPARRPGQWPDVRAHGVWFLRPRALRRNDDGVRSGRDPPAGHRGHLAVHRARRHPHPLRERKGGLGMDRRRTHSQLHVGRRRATHLPRRRHLADDDPRVRWPGRLPSLRLGPGFHR